MRERGAQVGGRLGDVASRGYDIATTSPSWHCGSHHVDVMYRGEGHAIRTNLVSTVRLDYMCRAG